MNQQLHPRPVIYVVSGWYTDLYQVQAENLEWALALVMLDVAWSMLERRVVRGNGVSDSIDSDES